MAAKTVSGVDGRTWSVRRNIEWSMPATGDDFEHDVDGGRGAAVLILSALFLFWAVLVVWTPEQVYIPWFFWVVGVVVVAFFPFRWWLRRPWTVVAETAGSYDQPAERCGDDVVEFLRMIGVEDDDDRRAEPGEQRDQRRGDARRHRGQRAAVQADAGQLRQCGQSRQ